MNQCAIRSLSTHTHVIICSLITEMREELETAKLRVDARRHDVEATAKALVSDNMGGGMRVGLVAGCALGFALGAWAFFTNTKT